MSKHRVSQRITEYLGSGGLFNPELMNHDKVRDLLILARNAIDDLLAQEQPEASTRGICQKCGLPFTNLPEHMTCHREQEQPQAGGEGNLRKGGDAPCRQQQNRGKTHSETGTASTAAERSDPNSPRPAVGEDRLIRALNEIRKRSEPISGERPDEINWHICMDVLPKEMFITAGQLTEILDQHPEIAEEFKRGLDFSNPTHPADDPECRCGERLSVHGPRSTCNKFVELEDNQPADDLEAIADRAEQEIEFAISHTEELEAYRKDIHETVCGIILTALRASTDGLRQELQEQTQSAKEAHQRLMEQAKGCGEVIADLQSQLTAKERECAELRKLKTEALERYLTNEQKAQVQSLTAQLEKARVDVDRLEVESIEHRNFWQNCGFVHPYTCGNDECRSKTNQAPLRATKDGWVCDHCGYTQARLPQAGPREPKC